MVVIIRRTIRVRSGLALCIGCNGKFDLGKVFEEVKLTNQHNSNVYVKPQVGISRIRLV